MVTATPKNDNLFAGAGQADCVLYRVTTSAGSIALTEARVFGATVPTGFITANMLQGNIPKEKIASVNASTISGQIPQANIPVQGLKTLWSGGTSGLFMTDAQTAPLNQLVSNQNTGIVLAWSEYLAGTNPVKNSGWHYTFVPKGHISVSGTSYGVGDVWNTNYWDDSGNANVIGKYVYVQDSKITGHAKNNISNTWYVNNRSVLRRVYGV
jgi:hypothetical protein